MWKNYRFDWNSTGPSSGLAALASFEWDVATADWRQRKLADAVIDASDADSTISISVDTKSTDMSKTPGKTIVAGTSGALNTAANIKFRLCAVPVGMASTGTLGGKLDTSSGAYYTWALTSSSAIRKTVGMTNCPPQFRLRTMIGAAATGLRARFFISFRARSPR